MTGILVVFQLLVHDELDSAASPGIALFGYFPVVFQLLKKSIRSSCQCWWSGFGHRISVAFQLLEHEEIDPAANSGGLDFGMDFCRVPADGTRGSRSSCQFRWSGKKQGILSCSSCWNSRRSIQLGKAFRSRSSCWNTRSSIQL